MAEEAKQDPVQYRCSESDVLSTDEVVRLFGLLQHEAWPLVLRIMRGMHENDRRSLELESTAWDKVNVLRGRIQAGEELIGVLAATIPALYNRTLPREPNQESQP